MSTNQIHLEGTWLNNDGCNSKHLLRHAQHGFLFEYSYFDNLPSVKNMIPIVIIDYGDVDKMSFPDFN